jgi:hypothetical protein
MLDHISSMMIIVFMALAVLCFGVLLGLICRRLTRTYESEYVRGWVFATSYHASHSLSECSAQLGHAICDRDFCEGADSGFPLGFIEYMREHGV